MKHLVISLLIPFSVVILFSSCENEKKKESEIESKYCFPEELVNKVLFDSVRMEPVKNVLKLSGKVSAYEDRLAKIYPVVSGTIEQLKVSLGDYVSAGQTLATIKSGEIADIEHQELNAKSSLLLAQKNLEVANDLFKAGLTSEKDVVSAKTELEKAESEFKRAKEVKKIFGVKNNSLFVLKSPVSGFILEKNMSIIEGMTFREEEIGSFFTVADLNEILIVANVYESDISKVREGSLVNVNLVAYPDKVFQGKIDKIINVLDPETRVMKVRIKLPNPGFFIKPEMFANVKVAYQESGEMIAVPSRSIIFDKNKNYVIVYHSRCNIETREVEIYSANEEYTYIKSGLKEGEAVISRYQLLIYNSLNN